MKKLVATLLTLVASNSFAASGYIVTGATVTKVSATSNREDAFWLWYNTTGSDPCSGKVKFHLNNSGTEGTFQRAFTLATTALVAGNKVDIYSYTNTSDCLSAVSIDMRK